MRLAHVLGIVGGLLAFWAIAFLAPAALAVNDAHGRFGPAAGYLTGAGASLALGLLLGRLRVPGARVHRTEAMAVVACAWLGVAGLSSIPLAWAGLRVEDACFEAMSGITSTGASVLTDFGAHGRALFLWRAELQWVGGLGILALFVSVLPRLGIAGRQLFFAEASGPVEEGLTPQIRRTAGRLWVLYAALTALEAGLLVHFGMPVFDAVCNAMATLSTGGFSPNARSIEGYGLPACEWVIAAFMFLGGASFSLQYRALAGRPLALFRDAEFRLYALVAVASTVLCALLLAKGPIGEREWRLAAFQVTSLQSTTGFASVDFDRWPDALRAILMLTMVFGACAGSSGGGPKVVRYLLLFRHCRRELVREVHPQAVVPVRLGHQTVDDGVVRSVVMMVVVYFGVAVSLSLALAVLGSDLKTSATATLTCMSGTGPGLGPIGPMGNYAALPAASKWLLCAAMWLGRLEVVTVLALLRREVLRGVRWRR